MFPTTNLLCPLLNPSLTITIIPNGITMSPNTTLHCLPLVYHDLFSPLPNCPPMTLLLLPTLLPMSPQLLNTFSTHSVILQLFVLLTCCMSQNYLSAPQISPLFCRPFTLNSFTTFFLLNCGNSSLVLSTPTPSVNIPLNYVQIQLKAYHISFPVLPTP